MGKEIEAAAHARGHEVVLKVTQQNRASLTAASLKTADVVIEFSTPHAVLDNLHFCLDAGVPVVVGTTGWNQHLEAVRHEVEQKNGSLFYASNFSLGVNLFFKVNTYLAGLMNNYPNYDIEIEEIHHVHKLDKPSGTAISIAQQIVAQVKRKNRWSTTEKNPETLYITDRREGEVPGTHTVRYQSEIDDIEITHKAHNRKGFALGAVIAAEFLKGKSGVYTMDDLL